jgi:hypothetical protein
MNAFPEQLISTDNKNYIAMVVFLSGTNLLCGLGLVKGMSGYGQSALIAMLVCSVIMMMRVGILWFEGAIDKRLLSNSTFAQGCASLIFVSAFMLTIFSFAQGGYTFRVIICAAISLALFAIHITPFIKK